jgi:hypothetical protein
MSHLYFKYVLKLISEFFKGQYYFNFRLFTKKATNNSDSSIFKVKYSGLFAIVIQGPLIEKSNFTLETIKSYRFFYPKEIIIFSTWQVDTDIIEKLEDLDVHLIQNRYPDYCGISNINLQIVTTQSGLYLAKKLGAEYVLKTRSDQRIYHPGFASYLNSLVDAFPLFGNILGQKKRIVGISLNTFKFRIYGLSDHFIYGYIDDILLYFDVELDCRRFTPEDIVNFSKTYRQFSYSRICEIYLCSNFLNKVGRSLRFDLSNSFEMLRDHFIIIDQSAIKLFWNKYTLDQDRFNYYGFCEPEISFNDWLILYNTDKMEPINESILDQLIHK